MRTVLGTRRSILVIMAVGPFAAGCVSQGYGGPSPAQMGLASASAGALREFGGKLPFRSRFGAAARQLLEGGVVIRLEPEDNSFRLTEAELNGGAIIGHFRKESDGALRRFGLGESDHESYWMAFRANGQYYGRFVSASMDTTYAISVVMHDAPEAGYSRNLPWTQAIAQFGYLAGEEKTPRKSRGDGVPMLVTAQAIQTGWVSCTAFGCCRTQ